VHVMKTSQDANKDRHGQPQQPQMRVDTQNTPPPHTSEIQTRRLPKSEDSHIGNMTIFRASNFFVHTVPRRPVGNTSLLEQVRWASTERQHVLESGTRLLPDTNLINPLLQTEIVISVWIEVLVVLLVLGIGMVIHGWGMNTFPAYQQNEGLLMSNAWAVTHGMIQPYAYTYTQTFLGWIQIAGWLRITGGPMTFDNAINSGRAMMLVLSAASGLLVYVITSRMSHSRSAGLLALALFEFSPLAITYQREISLDTIGTFWLLLALYLLVISDSRLLHIVLASIVLGIAILTKGVFIIFFPVMLYAVSLHVTAFQRKFALVVFIYIVFSLVSVFVLFAALKGELLPTGALPWDDHPHPSLWEGIIANIQSAQKNSDFGLTWHIWIQYELPFFIASTIAIGINLFVGSRSPLHAFLALLLISFWAFLLITGFISTSYLVIFFPLMALNVAIAVNALLKWPSNRFGFDLVRVILIFGLIGILIPYRIQHAQTLMTQDATNPQTSALNWIRSNLPANSAIIVDSYLYADLHEPEGPTGKDYPRTHIYWNVVLDPDVRFKALKDNWQNIDYIILDAQMQKDIRTRPSDMSLLDQALNHATLIQTFNAANLDPSAAVQIYQVKNVSGK
jgi:hypothetical protein